MNKLKRYDPMDVCFPTDNSKSEKVYLCSQADRYIAEHLPRHEEMRIAIAIYCREELGHIEFDDDNDAIRYFCQVNSDDVPQPPEADDE